MLTRQLRIGVLPIYHLKVMESAEDNQPNSRVFTFIFATGIWTDFFAERCEECKLFVAFTDSICDAIILRQPHVRMTRANGVVGGRRTVLFAERVFFEPE